MRIMKKGVTITFSMKSMISRSHNVIAVDTSFDCTIEHHFGQIGWIRYMVFVSIPSNDKFKIS